jgi:L-cysteine/cystine lyase
VSIRSDLPALEGVAYLNSGTNGPMPRAAADAMRAEVDAAVSEPRIGRPAFERIMELRARARAALGRVVGAPPERIALTNSTTQGIGAVIAGIDWNPGDEVLTTTEEHPGLTSPLDVISSRHGVNVVAVPAEQLEERITGRTRMVAVSHVLWTTGRVLDTPALAAAAHDAGASLLLDAAQSAGAIPVDAEATGADFYAFSGQKWLLGPQGTGGLWVSPEWTEKLWTAQSSFWNLQGAKVGEFHDTAGRLDQGTLDTVGLAGITAALEWVESIPGGRKDWERVTGENAARARARLRRQPGVAIGEHDREDAPLVAITVDGVEDTVELTGRLAEQGILIRYIPDTPWMRASIGAWTTDDEVDRLANALTDG